MKTRVEPGQDWTVVLRRQPARIVAGQAEGGYTDAFEIICCDCGDHPDLDYGEVSPELQRIRGPYPIRSASPPTRGTSPSTAGGGDPAATPAGPAPAPTDRPADRDRAGLRTRRPGPGRHSRPVPGRDASARRACPAPPNPAAAAAAAPQHEGECRPR